MKFNFQTLLNLKIDKIFCISIEKRTDRREFLKTQFEKFENTVDFKIVHRHKDPVRGCLESHISCIKEAKENNYENILILEDDILIDEKVLSEIQSPIYVPDDFDMFYLGYHVNNGIRYGANVLKLISAQTTHAYIMNQRVFDYVLDNIEKDWKTLPEWNRRNNYENMTNFNVRAIDLFYAKWVHHHRNKSYGIYPMLINQKPDFSDIENRRIDYRDLMKKKSDEFFKEKVYKNEIWILNLERRSDRWKDMNEKVAKYDLNAYRINAIDGSKFNFEKYKELFSLRDYRLRVKNPYQHHQYNRGVLGCALSHYTMWESIINNDNMSNEDYILIMEDDCKFVDDFETKFYELLEQLKYIYWDICYLGYTDYVALDTDKEENNLIKLSGEPRTRGGGTFGYLITKAGAKKFYEAANDRSIQQAVDWFMIEQYDKVVAYKTKNDLIFSNVAGVEGHDSDVQNKPTTFLDLELTETDLNGNKYLTDQYDNVFELTLPFKINYVGHFNKDDNLLEINKFHLNMVKSRLKFKKINDYIAIYAGDKMNIFIHYFAKYLKNVLGQKVAVYYNDYDLKFDGVRYINVSKFDKLNNILKYTHIYSFNLLIFINNLVRPWNKLILVEDGELFMDTKFNNITLPNNGITLVHNMLKKIDKVLALTDTNAHYFKNKTQILNNVESIPPLFFNDNDVFTDELKLNDQDVLFVSYDQDVKSIIKFFDTLDIQNKKLLIFSDVYQSQNPEMIIKPMIYKFNTSYLDKSQFFITETRTTDNMFYLYTAYSKGNICIIPKHYQELANKSITFLNTLEETKDKVVDYCKNQVRRGIYKKINNIDVEKIKNNLKSSSFK